MSLTACDARGIQRASQAELVGEWDWNDAQSKYPEACGSTRTLKYFSSGKYFMLGVVGTWRLEGNVLTETPSRYIYDDSLDDLGQTSASILKWVDPDAFVARHTNGNAIEYRRCPKFS